MSASKVKTQIQYAYNMIRNTDWRMGLVVRTLKPIRSLTNPYVVPEGAIFTLWKLERVQEGCEIWSAWYGFTIFCFTEHCVEPAYGPVVEARKIQYKFSDGEYHTDGPGPASPPGDPVGSI